MIPFGIGNLAFHIPSRSIELATLIESRIAQGISGDRLERARSFTGQQYMRLADWYEDPVTMVAEATRSLLGQPQAPTPEEIRHFYCGTETAQDEAKPISSYVQGLLEINGRRIGPQCASFETKHACASGTYALLSGLNSLVVEHLAGSSSAAIAGMGDVASYPPGSTAELTQGAGAVAVLLEANPRLLAIDPGITGFWGEDVDDFFRAVGHRHATVRGRYSVECYLRALQGAYDDYKRQALTTGLLTRPPGGHFLDTVDYVVLHAPFQSLPVQAMMRLLEEVRKLSRDEATQELERLRVSAGTSLIRHTGNLYTGSLYLCLADLLESECQRLGTALEGKRILLGSYGSGNTMVVFGGTVARGACQVIEGWNLRQGILRQHQPVSLAEYEFLSQLDKFSPDQFNSVKNQRVATIPSGAYHLDSIRDDGYRVYSKAPLT
jgi:hydroxymethylglutaryl-CoA synthase